MKQRDDENKKGFIQNQNMDDLRSKVVDANNNGGKSLCNESNIYFNTSSKVLKLLLNVCVEDIYQFWKYNTIKKQLTEFVM